MSVLCQLINPLCVNDLCILSHNHAGLHQLGTMPEPGELPPEIRLVDNAENTWYDAAMLEELGRAERSRLWPEEYPA